MEAKRDLFGRICLVLDPRLGVVKLVAQRHGNLVNRNIVGHPMLSFTNPDYFKVKYSNHFLCRVLPCCCSFLYSRL
jgi:hypothetical protein